MATHSPTDGILRLRSQADNEDAFEASQRKLWAYISDMERRVRHLERVQRRDSGMSLILIIGWCIGSWLIVLLQFGIIG